MPQRPLPTRILRFAVLACCLAMCAGNILNSQADDAAAPATQPGRGEFVASGNDALYYVVSPDRTGISAFSKHTGRWESQAIELVEQEQAIPLVGGDFVIFTAGKMLHAFNARTGNWCSAEIPDGERRGPIVSAELAVGQAGNTLFAFSAHHDEIHTIELESDEIVDMSVGREMAIGRIGDHWYGYSPLAGKWDSMEIPAAP